MDYCWSFSDVAYENCNSGNLRSFAEQTSHCTASRATTFRIGEIRKMGEIPHR